MQISSYNAPLAALTSQAMNASEEERDRIIKAFIEQINCNNHTY